MSSTYAHYQGPASLPSDYAILSRYAGHHTEGEGDDHDAGAYYRPPKPTIGSRPDSPEGNIGPTEYTPLLAAPPVPRIEEDIEEDSVSAYEHKRHVYLEEFWILCRYAWPVFGTHLLEYTLIIAPVISVGHISTVALASISLGSMTASVTGYSIIQGFCSALDTMLPSAWTSPHPQFVGLWAQRMTVVMAVLLVPVLLTWLNAENILLFLKQDPEVAHFAAIYLRWATLGLPAYTFNCISRRYFQSQGLFAIPTKIIMAVAPVNALLNYLLVWGPAPIRLGFIGAPIASAISFNLISLMSLIYGIYFVPKTAWHPLSSRMFTSLGVLVHLGLSGVGQTASEWWAWELVALAASLLGPVVLATQSVLLVSASMTFQAPFALGVATSVRIGNLLGEQKGTRAGVAARTSIFIALIISLFTSSLFLVCRNFWGRLFNDDEEVVQLVATILPLVALFQVMDGIGAVTAGILRAVGKQFLGALLNLSSYYIIGIPFGIWLAFRRDMGLHGLWIGLSISLLYSSVFGTIVCLRTDWDRQVEKVVKRMRDEEVQRNAEMHKAAGTVEGRGGENGETQGLLGRTSQQN
ncbi:mate-domain-containing protein [Coprinopsis sp. MPI-PUGE-AT-0042]|nr:mate-domain-containing protein [Coprinopsis sp. MPI-PUGE-AT-0042]